MCYLVLYFLFRTKERVEISAKVAGIHGQQHCVQLLSFEEKLHNEDLKLMEVNADVVEELKDGKR